MKRFIVSQVLSLLLALVFLTSSAMAIGLGVYYNGYGSGSADWTEDHDGWELDYEGDTESTGFGFVLDTAVAKDTLFNYRLNIGLEDVTKEEGDGVVEAEFDSYVIDNTFGFAVLRKKVVRLWLGPQLRISYSEGNPINDPDFDINLVGFGLGAVFGANFNIGRVFTPAVSIGYRYTKYIGTGDYSNSSYYTSPEVDYDVTETRLFVNLAVLFRMGDVF